MPGKSKHEGTIDQWQSGSVTPPEHNLKRSRGTESPREARLADPKAPHQEPSGRELRRKAEREARLTEDEPKG
jgi:hypothetical protein